jgi:hypothetical protein
MITKENLFTINQKSSGNPSSPHDHFNMASRSNFGPNFKDALKPLIGSFKC